MATRMQQRRGTAAQWTSADPILAAGEFGFETDTGEFRVGDGVNHWSDLSPFKNIVDLGGNLDDYVPLSVVGQPDGVASLNADGFVTDTQVSYLLPIIRGSEEAYAQSINSAISYATTFATDADAVVLSSAQSDATTKANNAKSGAEGTAATALSAHATDSTDIHGISNTANLVYTNDSRLSDTRTPSDSSVTEAKIANDAVTTGKILDGAVTSAKIANGTIVAGDIADGTITSAKIADGTILDGDIAGTAGIAQSKISGLTTDLAAKATLADPTFTGTVVLPSTTSIGNVSATEIGYVDGVTSAIQTQLDSKLSKSGGTMTGALTLSGAPTSDLHAATKLYVDGLAAGINFHQPVVAATTGDLAGTYDNGTNGLGATLTKASNGAIGTIDGASVSVGNRILLRAQTDTTQNGIYTVTAVGSVSAPWQITRATDADNNPAGELATGDFCFVTGGSTNAAKGFILSTTETITIGTTGITYSQFNASEAVTAGSGITKSGSTISISTGAITSDMIADGTIVNADINSSAAIDQSKISGLSTSLGLKANLATPSFTGGVTVDSSGIIFTDGTQVKQGVPSLTSINQQTSSYTTVLSDRDKLVEVSSSSGVTVTIPKSDTVAYPVGTSIDILQTSTGQVTIAGASGVTVNATPGLKLRTQWSSATLFKRATDTWVVFGDLTA